MKDEWPVGLNELPCRFKPRLAWPINSISGVWVGEWRPGGGWAKSYAAGVSRGGWVQLPAREWAAGVQLRRAAGGVAAACRRVLPLTA